jgi:hypothetical protein
MDKVIWELHVEGKESGFERYINTFDTRQDAMQFVDAARRNLALVFGEPLNCWLYQYKAHLNGRVRVNGQWRRANHG